MFFIVIFLGINVCEIIEKYDVIKVYFISLKISIKVCFFMEKCIR